MDVAGRFDGGAALLDDPTADFLVAGGEEQHLARDVHDPPHQRFPIEQRHPHLFAERPAFLRLHLRESQLQRHGHRHDRHARLRTAFEPGRVQVVVGQVDDDHPPFLAEQLERADRQALLRRQGQRMQCLAVVQGRPQRLQQGHLFQQLFAVRPRPLQLVVHAFDPPRDDVQVGDQQVVLEVPQVGPGIVAVEGGHDDQQALGFTDQRQPRGAAFVRTAQARRVHDLQMGVRHFLGLVDLAQRFIRGSTMVHIAICVSW